MNKKYTTHPKSAWLFDVDGVITNPLAKAITQPEMIPQLIRRLDADEPVGIVSGRALPWLITQVVNVLEKHIDRKEKLENLFVSAEFGGVSIHYKNGKEVTVIDRSISLPDSLKTTAENIVKNEFSDSIFVDPEKTTHFSAEMNRGISLEQFRRRQLQLSEKLERAVHDGGYDAEIEVHNDRIATNVKNRKLNKHLATKKVVEWLDEKGISPISFVVFGDAKSDLEMGDELHLMGKPLTFVYVGEGDTGDVPFPIILQGGVDEGTVDYLKSH